MPTSRKTLTFQSEPELRLRVMKKGIRLTWDLPDILPEQVIHIPWERLDKAIAFLHDAQAQHQREDWKE